MKILLPLFACITLVLSGFVYANDQYEVLESESTYQRIKIKDPEYLSLFEEGKPGYTQTEDINAFSSSVVLNEPTSTQEVVIVRSLQGVLDANLPEWLQDEFLEEAGYLSWAEVPDSVLNEEFDVVSIDLDALSQIDPEVNSSLDYQPLLSIRNPCSKKWVDKSKVITKPVTFSKNKYSTESGVVSSTFTGVFDGSGDITASIHYKLKKRCGVYYKAQFSYADIFARLNSEAKLGLDGTLYQKYETHLFQDSLNLFHFREEWWVYFFEFRLDLDLDVDYGVKLLAEASASFDTDHNVAGSINASWRCTSSRCWETSKKSDFKFGAEEGTQTSAQAKVVITPYVDTNFTADVDMYWGSIDIARAKIGVVTAVPLTFFGYYGNMCSDANDDGVVEFADAAVIDVTGEIYAYLEVELFNENTTFDLDLKVGSWEKTVVDGKSAHVQVDTSLSLYRKNIYYKDLIGSSVMEPVIRIPDVVSQDGGLILDKRSCYPFEESLTYIVDWGDGSEFYQGRGGLVSHSWPQYGDYMVSARLLSDRAGRDFDERWVTKVVNVSPTGSTPFYPWLIPIISSVLLH